MIIPCGNPDCPNLVTIKACRLKRSKVITCSLDCRVITRRKRNSLITEKRCTGPCDTIKPLNAFRPHKNSLAGCMAVCIVCERLWNDDYRLRKGKIPKPKTLAERFWSKVRICDHGRDCKDCCWRWQRRLTDQGYGQFYRSGHTTNAHIVSYELTVGTVADGLVVRHTCDVPSCVNPQHLLLGTHQQNTQDMVSRGRVGNKRRLPPKVKPGIRMGLGLQGYAPETITWIETKLWSKVIKQPNDGCWLWQGNRSTRGYGLFRIAPHDEQSSRTLLTHRLAWAFTHGPIPQRLFVLHRCDTPSCCRPDHLFLGTQSDNRLDCLKKGRQPIGDQHYSRIHPERLARGERHGMTKWSDSDVSEMRALKGILPIYLIAKQFKISLGYLQKILSGHSRN